MQRFFFTYNIYFDKITTQYNGISRIKESRSGQQLHLQKKKQERRGGK